MTRYQQAVAHRDAALRAAIVAAPKRRTMADVHESLRRQRIAKEVAAREASFPVYVKPPRHVLLEAMKPQVTHR